MPARLHLLLTLIRIVLFLFEIILKSFEMLLGLHQGSSPSFPT